MVATSTGHFVSRALRQMDRSFWCLHDDLATFAVLGLPTFITFGALGSSLAIVLRTFDLDLGIGYLIWGIVVPVTALMSVTFLPLPCSVFAWSKARGQRLTAGECFAVCIRRIGRLAPVILWMAFSFTWWVILAGLPLLILWPRTCLAPMVALFEDQRRVFWRSRRLMHEDHAIYVLAGLYLLMMLVLGSLIFVPRLILFADVIKTPWVQTLENSIWAFELVSGIILLTGVAVSWCVALTLFYHDLRYHREGELLRNKIEVLYEKYVPAGGAV